MQQISPYTIHHLQLEVAFEETASILVKGGHYYLVYWWRTIPLGHAYIDNYNGNVEDLKQAVVTAIQPAVNTYTTSEEIVVAAQAFLKKDYQVFSKMMDDLLGPFLRTLPLASVQISVVICTRQRSKDLESCIQSLLKQTYPPQEILVVDNAPLDNSTQAVAQKYKKVTYCLEPNKGLDFARNTGAKNATFPIVAYIDDDVQLHPLWSYRVWESFQDPRIDALTGLILALNLETESQQIFEKIWGFNKGFVDLKFDKAFVSTPKKRPRVWDIGAGANMAFRKSVLQQVNYFDERLDVGAAGCNGDSEIWFRILSAGYTIAYNPRAVAYHQHRNKLSDLHRQLFSYMRGHTAAALIQHQQDQSADYKGYVYRFLPKYYFMLFLHGFPTYSFRYRTLWSEVKGIISGIKYFNKNKDISPINQSS